MAEDETDPTIHYTSDHWKWEFLRRNERYIKAYNAIAWLRKRAHRKDTSPFFRGFGLLEPVHFLNLTNRLRNKLSVSHPRLKGILQIPGEWVGSLPSPDRAAHEFECSPISINPICGVYDDRDFQGYYSRHPDDEELLMLTAGKQQVIAVIDTRCKLDDIISELKELLKPYLSKERNQVKKYKEYLAVWDLRHKDKTQDEVARTLWPDEYKSKGGRDPELSERKGALLQRVHDHENACQELIDASFAVKKRGPKSTKQKQTPP